MTLLQTCIDDISTEIGKHPLLYTSLHPVDIIRNRLIVLPNWSSEFIHNQLVGGTINPKTDLYIGPMIKSTNKLANTIDPDIPRGSLGMGNFNELYKRDLKYVKRVFINFDGMYFSDALNYNKLRRAINSLYHRVAPDALYIVT